MQTGFSLLSLFRKSVALGALAAVVLPLSAAGEEQTTWRVPIVMEKATVRGKIVILENRSEDRRVLEGLKVQVWSDPEESQPSGKIHETLTDDAGLFSLPELEVGEYFLTVARLRLRLTVVPNDPERAGQLEPKVLLILLPKDVV